MKHTSWLAAIVMMAAMNANANTVNWVIENPSAYGTGVWAFLIQGGVGDKGSITPVPFELTSYPPPADLPGSPGGAVTGSPIIWNPLTEKLEYVGGGVVSGIAIIGAVDFSTDYAVTSATSGYDVKNPNGSIQVASSTAPGQAVYNEREFLRLSYEDGAPLTDWDPAAGYFYMLLFDSANGRFAIVEPIQVTDAPGSGGSYVQPGDIVASGDPLDPYFPQDKDGDYALSSLVWYDIPGWGGGDGGDGPGGCAGWGNPGFWGNWDNPSVIPEPTTASLLAIGCAVLGLRRRFRK